MAANELSLVEFGLPKNLGICQTCALALIVVQPQVAKRIVAVAVGLIVLGAVIWVSAKSQSNPAEPDTTIGSAIMGLSPDALAAPPNKVVTMLSVPEVIYSSMPENSESAPEAKPSKPLATQTPR